MDARAAKPLLTARHDMQAARELYTSALDDYCSIRARAAIGCNFRGL